MCGVVSMYSSLWPRSRSAMCNVSYPMCNYNHNNLCSSSLFWQLLLDMEYGIGPLASCY